MHEIETQLLMGFTIIDSAEVARNFSKVHTVLSTYQRWHGEYLDG